jgi:U32 family peptidase
MKDISKSSGPIHIPELLAPAGSPEAFRAAVAAGADAIYLSGKRFGARKFAANFSDNEIEEAVRYAHTYCVRVYVTVNTLIHDRELGAVSEYLIWLYSIGVDAVLVQDMGLADLARTLVPGLVLHASTQMTIHNAAGVRWAAEHGLSRVVLARELALEEIRTIIEETKDTGTGLEVFAHGALCYSYSGQCLLSSVIGGRSGNRGMCAQPCRKPFTLVTGAPDRYGRAEQVQEIPTKDPYLLSPKDLCTYPRLPELVSVPLASLKIEGRMKSPEYVAIVVSTYRRALDAIAAGSWHPSEEELRDLFLAFNRGFTTGYIFGQRHGRLMGRDAPDNRGLLIGKVTRYDKNQSLALVRPEVPLIPVPGDGLLISSRNPREETGFALNTRPALKGGEFLIRVPKPVCAGSEVYLTSSLDLATRARQILAKPPRELRRLVPIDLEISIRDDGSVSFNGLLMKPDGSTIPVAYTPDLILAEAKSQPLTTEMLEQQMRKTGGTPFVIRHLTHRYRGDRFAPVAEINRIRREFLATAEEQLVASYRPDIHEVRHAQHQWQEKNIPGPASESGTSLREKSHTIQTGIYVDNLDGVQAAAAAGIAIICFEPDLSLPGKTCGDVTRVLSPASVLAGAQEICRSTGSELVWKLPRITRDPYLASVLPEIPAIEASGISTCMVENIGTAMALREADPTIRITGSVGMNVFNHATVMALIPLFASVTLSPELSRDEIACLISGLAKEEATTPCALVIQGTSEAIVTEDCLQRLWQPCSTGNPGSRNEGVRPFLGIRDETGHIFPVRVDGGCRTRIGNARELCLIDYLPSLCRAGIRDIIVDARGRTPEYIRTMGGLYVKAADWTNTHPEAKDGHTFLTTLKDEVKKISLGGITTGHFLRGLKE